MPFWVLLVVGLAFSSVGFLMYIYFFSVGYGFSVAAIGAALLIAYGGRMGIPEIMLCGLLVFYGLRLGTFLLYRDVKSDGYRKILNPERDRSRGMTLGPKLAIWISCAVLYALMTSPVCFRLQNGAKADAMLWVGFAVMLSGVVLELAADIQKSLAKKKDSGRFVDTGLYRLVRCPNYLGELVLWFGVYLTGTTAFASLWQWIAGTLGDLLIAYVMFSGARRLELRQERNYGEDPEYRAYVRRTPILLPFVPLYSVKKYGFLIA